MTTKNSIPKSNPSVNTLKSLVPSPDLCKQIPEGKFENSALVWTFDDRLMPRTIMIDGVRHYYRGFPAPTLQEILVDLSGRFDDACCCNACEKGMYYVQVEDFEVQKEFFEYSNNPATAALKLWLEINKEGNEK